MTCGSMLMESGLRPVDLIRTGDDILTHGFLLA
jgi:hypothetical protein